MRSEDKKFIDQSSYETLLRKWRFASVGDDMFQGEIGDYYKRVMFEKRDALGPEAASAVSKQIGW